MVTLNNVFLIILERSDSIVFSVYSRSSLKKTDFRWMRKRLYSSRLMFNIFTKLTKSWWDKIECNMFCFISVRVRTVLRFLVQKSSGNTKDCLEINLWRKKEHRKTFRSMRNFFRVTMFNWLFSWFFRIINVYQLFYTLNTVFFKYIICEVNSREVETQKKFFVRYHLYRYYLKTVTDDLN